MSKNINIILAGFVIILCLVFSYFVLFTDAMSDKLPGNKRIIFVCVVLSYAAFRSFRLFKQLKESKNENQDEDF